MGDATQSDVLGPLERQAMSHLWQAGAASVHEVMTALNASRTPPLAYTTVMTVLVRLFEKGYVTRSKDGRGFRYAAAVDAASIEKVAARREIEQLAERFGRSTVAAFAADVAGADPELVRRLGALANRTDEGGPS